VRIILKDKWLSTVLLYTSDVSWPWVDDSSGGLLHSAARSVAIVERKAALMRSRSRSTALLTASVGLALAVVAAQTIPASATERSGTTSCGAQYAGVHGTERYGATIRGSVTRGYGTGVHEIYIDGTSHSSTWKVWTTSPASTLVGNGYCGYF